MSGNMPTTMMARIIKPEAESRHDGKHKRRQHQHGEEAQPCLGSLSTVSPAPRLDHHQASATTASTTQEVQRAIEDEEANIPKRERPAIAADAEGISDGRSIVRQRPNNVRQHEHGKNRPRQPRQRRKTHICAHWDGRTATGRSSRAGLQRKYFERMQAAAKRRTGRRRATSYCRASARNRRASTAHSETKMVLALYLNARIV